MEQMNFLGKMVFDPTIYLELQRLTNLALWDVENPKRENLFFRRLLLFRSIKYCLGFCRLGFCQTSISKLKPDFPSD